MFLKAFSTYARPIPVQTKVHLKNLHFLAVKYDRVFFMLCFRRFLNDNVFPVV